MENAKDLLGKQVVYVDDGALLGKRGVAIKTDDENPDRALVYFFGVNFGDVMVGGEEVGPVQYPLNSCSLWVDCESVRLAEEGERKYKYNLGDIAYLTKYNKEVKIVGYGLDGNKIIYLVNMKSTNGHNGYAIPKIAMMSEEDFGHCWWAYKDELIDIDSKKANDELWKEFHVGYRVKDIEGRVGFVICVIATDYAHCIGVKFRKDDCHNSFFHNCDECTDESYIEGGGDPEKANSSWFYFPSELTILDNIELGDRVYDNKLRKNGTVISIHQWSDDYNSDEEYYGVEFDEKINNGFVTLELGKNYIPGNREGKPGYCQWCYGRELTKITNEVPEVPEIDDWKVRFVDEYKELEKRISALIDMMGKWNVEKLDYTFKTPYALFAKQLNAMLEYKSFLKIRAEIEGIKISE